MIEAARLLFPPIRWDPDRGDWDGADRIESLLSLGVGGFILFGGRAHAVAELTTRLRSRSPHPLLIGADLERGAGQQFDGATPLPPAAALASLDDLSSTRRAGALTGREARALGVDWVYAPVADVDLEPANPIVGTRSFGTDPAGASRQVAAWIEGCRSAGALACAKHFPGHGRTTGDSHLSLPTVGAGRDALEADLAPFRAAIRAGVDSIMTAHVAFPALDPSGVPATLSRPIVDGLLREELGFDGLVVTDALIMEGVTAGTAGRDGDPAVRAVAAGCDVLLYPADPEAVAAALEAAQGGALPEDRLAEAAERVRLAAERSPGGQGRVGAASDRQWALELAVRTVHPVRGEPTLPDAFEVVTVDDDIGGPHPTPARTAFPATLRKSGVASIPVDTVTAGRPVIVAVYADTRGFKGRVGLTAEAAARVRGAVAGAPTSLVVLFGHPRLATEVPGEHVLCAWGGEPLMQEAAAVRLIRGRP